VIEYVLADAVLILACLCGWLITRRKFSKKDLLAALEDEICTIAAKRIRERVTQ
jgi:hypothetical protein